MASGVLLLYILLKFSFIIKYYLIKYDAFIIKKFKLHLTNIVFDITECFTCV